MVLLRNSLQYINSNNSSLKYSFINITSYRLVCKINSSLQFQSKTATEDTNFIGIAIKDMIRYMYTNDIHYEYILMIYMIYI